MRQWHPIFAQLLRPAVEDYYEVQTTMPVGDAPREADFVLVRRTASAPPPFHGLWRHLSTWNVLEYKGPTVSPRLVDLDLLIELGLGIDRRLQAQRIKTRQRRLAPDEVSFWYLANRLGQRFLDTAEKKLGRLESLGPGLWRCNLLERMIFLVSGVELPVEADSLPLHVVCQEPLATERQVAQLVLEHPTLQQMYGGWLASLHPQAWKEIEDMARATGKRLKFDIRPAIESLGLDEVIQQVGLDRVIEQVGADRVIEQVGAEQFIAKMGKKELVNQIGVEAFFESLSPAQRRDFKRRLEK